MLHVDPSATVTGEGALCDRKVENIFGLPVMWFVAPESITQLFEEEIKHAFLESTRVVTEVNSFRDSWYWENCANSSAETKIFSPFWFVAIMKNLRIAKLQKVPNNIRFQERLEVNSPSKIIIADAQNQEQHPQNTINQNIEQNFDNRSNTKQKIRSESLKLQRKYDPGSSFRNVVTWKWRSVLQTMYQHQAKLGVCRNWLDDTRCWIPKDSNGACSGAWLTDERSRWCMASCLTPQRNLFQLEKVSASSCCSSDTNWLLWKRSIKNLSLFL